MTKAKEAVKYLCDEVYKKQYTQILIDLVQDVIEKVIEQESVSREEVGSISYHVENLLIAINPSLKNDLTLLNKLNIALTRWEVEIEETNKLLGLPPQS